MNRKDLSKIKQYLRKQPIKLAYLYGSAVAGQMHAGSDIDIAVVMKDEGDKDFLRIGTELAKLLPNYKFDVRELSLDSDLVFGMNVINQSRPIYVENEEQRISFELRLMDKYYDSKRIRRINYLYLKDAVEKGNYGYPA